MITASGRDIGVASGGSGTGWHTMNHQGFSRRNHHGWFGTARALLGSVTTLAMAAVALTPGCLLMTKRVVPDDAETTPLVTTAIVQDPNRTQPLPGSIVILPVGINTLRLRVVLARGDNEVLTARLFRDRSRPCSLERFNCGVPAVNDQIIPAPEAGVERLLQVEVPFPARDGVCHRLDLYVSPEFRSGSEEERHEPARAGDVVHARWYVITRTRDTSLPSITDCAID